MMKRVLSLLVTVILCGKMMFAQSVDDGRKFVYYERYNSAKEVFDKILAADPNNIDAVYWLGQTLLKQKDTAAAKALYQKTLTSNGNAPLVLVGMGEILLLENKKDEARQQFENAINMTKGKDVDVLNAIGRANVDAKAGDASYAVEKLKQATETRRFKDYNTYLIMGDAYRKLIDGGNAVTAYNKALEMNPNLAAAKNRIGKIYVTQNNPEFFLPAFEEAVKIDPAYAPAYFELYYYWYYHDVNKAGQYLDKFVANTDPGPEMEYSKTDYMYAKSDFNGAKTRAQQLISQYGEKVDPRMYRMVAYASDTLGDIQAAKDAMTTYFQKEDTDQVVPSDYEEMAKINSQIPGMESEVFNNYMMAIEKDTSVANKIKLIQNAAALAKKSGDRTGEARWLGQAYAMDKNPSARDLYNWAYAHYQAGNYQKADSLFCGDYISKYPDEIYGYLWCARSKQAQDTTMKNGLAVDAYKTLGQKAIELDTSADKKLQPFAINADYYLVSYYNDIAKEKDTAIAYINKVLELDPTNENALRVKEILTAPPPKASATRSSSSKSAGTKPKTATKKKSK